jgi:outer membrane protein
MPRTRNEPPNAPLTVLLACAAALLAAPSRADEPMAPRPAEAPRPTSRRAVPLREALQLAVKQGPDVAAARAQAAVAEAGIKRAYTVWQPELTANGTFDHTSAASVFDVGAFIIGAGKILLGPTWNPTADQLAQIPPPTEIVAANSWYGQAQLSQPLFTPQGIFLPAIARWAAEAVARGADEAREQVLLAVARAYFLLQGVEGLVQAAKDLEAVSLRREEEARTQIRAGTAVELNLLRAQTDTAGARVQIADLEGTREILLPLLEALTGDAIEPLPSSGNSGLPQPGDAASEPWEQSNLVKAAAAAVKAQAEALDLDKWLWLPSVVGIAKGNYNSNEAFSGHNWSWDLIVAASIPLYDRGLRYAARAEDEARLRVALANLASARAKARATWLGARANVAGAQATLAQAEAQAQLAARAQGQVDASFKAGVATSLDLTDADNKKFTAQSAVVQFRASLEVRRAEVAAVEGKLTDLAK